ncbi:MULTISPECIES: hypothetical protein [Serratia]|uniref:hypothetical protein n=1 Tax=Serratia TaxID=613 RepID=UPI0027E3F018|nr:hypothetical protein [Serratia marcescens]MCW7561409.1 hypothetical protein [Serratia marcescens]MCW7566388.1 hypothetical protein [Serratia marcescens]MCW7571388.1 hypothetical protein [Serratia marcescens]MCW7576389.1 hypothetical protein [Serratia marcescens]MCW7581389.1 hypothetical protein [Serratia marcescens]
MTTIKRFTPDYKMHAVRFEAFAREAEHGELVRFDAHQQVVSTLEAERDALAVENQALRSSVDLIASAYTEGEPAGFEIDRARHIETPATDAALAAIQAQGVEKYAADLDQIASESNPAEPKHTVASSYADDARSFAKKLREAK